MSARLLHIGALVVLAAVLIVTIAPAQHRAEEPAGAVAEGRALAVFNPVEGRIRVLSSRPDGARVEKGEVVCELDATGLEDRVASKQVAVEGLQAGLKGARLARQATEMDLSEYKEGGFVQELQAADGEIALAKSGLISGQDNQEWTTRMYQKGYASMFEKRAQDLALEKAKFALELAQSRRDELTRHTKEKATRERMAAVEASRERELAKQAELLREEAVLRRLHGQIVACRITAPVAGRVRYDAPIGPGAVIRDGQLVFRIVPDAAPAGAVK